MQFAFPLAVGFSLGFPRHYTDAVKTSLQVNGPSGLRLLVTKARTGGVPVFYHGALGAAAATYVGYAWAGLGRRGEPEAGEGGLSDGLFSYRRSNAGAVKSSTRHTDAELLQPPPRLAMHCAAPLVFVLALRVFSLCLLPPSLLLH